MYICKHCSYQTDYRQILTRHMKNNHPDIPIEVPIYKCIYCNKSFASSISCKKHEQNKKCQKDNSKLISSQEALDNQGSRETDEVYLSLPPTIKVSEIVPEHYDKEESNLEKEVIKRNNISLFTKIIKSPILKIIPIAVVIIGLNRMKRF